MPPAAGFMTRTLHLCIFLGSQPSFDQSPNGQMGIEPIFFISTARSDADSGTRSANDPAPPSSQRWKPFAKQKTPEKSPGFVSFKHKNAFTLEDAGARDTFRYRS